MKQPNRVKAAMRASRKAYGYSLSFPSPWVIDILGKLDFDYVFIDGEHGPFGLDQLEDLCRTAERYNLLTRVSNTSHYGITQHSGQKGPGRKRAPWRDSVAGYACRKSGRT
jgi:2-keto-3-deoxy-L-rhamnonate aldolase RhmA